MTLSGITPKLNPLIERAEATFARLFTVSAEIPLNVNYRLRYGKREQRWRLLLVSIADGGSQTLVSGSRAIRIDALANLPYLGVELAAETEAQAANAERVVAATEAYLLELEQR